MKGYELADLSHTHATMLKGTCTHTRSRQLVSRILLLPLLRPVAVVKKENGRWCWTGNPGWETLYIPFMKDVWVVVAKGRRNPVQVKVACIVRNPDSKLMPKRDSFRDVSTL